MTQSFSSRYDRAARDRFRRMIADDLDSVQRSDTDVNGETASTDDPAAHHDVRKLDPDARNVCVWVHGPVLRSRSGDIIWVTEQQARDYDGYVTRVYVVAQ